MSGRILRVPVLQKLLQAWPWWLLLLALAEEQRPLEANLRTLALSSRGQR